MTTREELRRDAEAIWRAGVEAVDGRALVAGWCRDHGDALRVRGRVVVLAAGKGSPAMARGALDVLGERVAGGAVTGAGEAGELGLLEWWPGGHPHPTAGSVAAAERALGIASTLGPDDLCLVLISGGASAMWVAPEPGWTLEALVARNRELLAGGLDIEAVNRERSRGDRMKNGGLVRAAGAARVVCLVLSDVPGTPRWVGSGPAVGADVFEVVGDSSRAVAGAVREARQRGFRPLVVDGSGLFSEVLEAHRLAGADPGVAVISGGEAPVVVSGPGRGGRNLHFALALAVEVVGRDWAAAIGGTDGLDGETPYAGAIVDGGSIGRGRAAGLDPRASLEACDAARFLEASGDAWTTGRTGTNVMDLRVVVRAP